MNLLPQNPRNSHVSIRIAAFPQDKELVQRLFQDYQTDIDVDLCFQSFAEELATLPGKYTTIWLAEREGRTLGCIALRPLPEGRGEMKRLFVYPEGRGSGAGRALAQTLIESAQQQGLTAIRLDTIQTKMPSAVALYRTLGFREIAPYTANPMDGVLFMELILPVTADAEQ
jgi:putative acetyltransferase